MRRLVTVAATVAALIVTACGAFGPQLPELSIKGTDFAFEAPEQIAPGLTLVTLDNTGAAPHNLLIARLKDGKTVDEFKAATAKGPAGIVPLIDMYGGTTFTAPGQRRQVVLDLAAGQYVMLSTFAGEDKRPDFAKGMLRSISVAGTAPSSTPEPSADVTITLQDKAAYTFSAQVKTGKQTWRIAHQGQAPHNIVVAKLAAGKTKEDFAAWLGTRAGAAPAEFVGGTHTLGPGKRGWVILELSAGDYVVFDGFGAPSDSLPTSFSIK